MTDEKVIMLIEAKIQPQRRTELVEAARQYLPLVRAEAGVEAFHLSVREDDPNAFVFYEIYRSKAAQEFHLQQDFTKKFLATLKGAGRRPSANEASRNPCRRISGTKRKVVENVLSGTTRAKIIHDSPG